MAPMGVARSSSGDDQRVTISLTLQHYLKFPSFGGFIRHANAWAQCALKALERPDCVIPSCEGIVLTLNSWEWKP